MQRNKTCLYIIALAISLLYSVAGHAEKQQGVDGNEHADSVSFFNGIAVSVDAVGAVQRWVGDYGQYEAALRLNLKDRYFPIVEVGYGLASHDDDVTFIIYESSAPYGRVGMDFNVLKNKHDIYRLYVGGRYGYTSFKYDLSSREISDPYWEDYVKWGAEGLKATFHWLEAVVGVDAKLYGPFHLGWSVRYRSRISQKYDDVGKPWYVPGFGKNNNSNISATFNIGIEF